MNSGVKLMTIRGVLYLVAIVLSSLSFRAQAQCSDDYFGLVSINEIHRSGNNTRFVELKLLDASLDNSDYDDWTIQICASGGGCTGGLNLSSVDDSNLPWIVVPKSSISSKNYINLSGGTDVLLMDRNGHTIDYTSVAGYEPQRDLSCESIFPWQPNASNSHTVERDPDGVGDWQSVSGNSGDNSSGDNNNGGDITGPDISISSATVMQGETASVTVTLSSTFGSDITFDYITIDNSALAGVDYQTVSSSGLIAAGLSSTTIYIPTFITGDTSVSRFYVQLTSTNNAGIVGQIGVVAIVPPVTGKWQMEQNTWDGTAGEAIDSSNNNLNGTSSGNASTSDINPARTGDPGTCRFGDFNGMTSRITIADDDSLDMTEELTLSVWIRPTQITGLNRVDDVVVSKGDNYALTVNTNGMLVFDWGNDSLTSVTTLVEGAWVHVAATFKSGEQNLYINGVLDTASSSNTALSTNSDSLYISGPASGSWFGVPINFLGSFEGQIDELQIYSASLPSIAIETFYQETHACSIVPITPDHYEISHSSPGVTCEASLVTINAHDASHDAFNVTSNTDITITTNPVVDSVISSPVTMLAGTSSVSFYLNESDVLTNIDIDVTDGTASDLDDASSEDEVFDFLDTVFRFYADSKNTDDTPIGTQIAGKPSNVSSGNQSLALRAVRTNTDTGACEAAIEGTTAVELAYECNNPTTCTASNLLSLTGVGTSTISRNDNNTSLGYTSVNMEFDANGEAPFLFNYADAGEITLHARKSVAASEPEPAFELIGQSNPFVVTPFAFHFAVEDEPTATSGLSLNTYRKAGEGFNVTLRPVVYESGDDASNNDDLANNVLTPNFGRHSIIDLTLGFDLQAPTDAGTSKGVLSGWANPSTAFNNTGTLGERVFENLNWSEVGIISMNSLHSNYLGGGLNISGSRSNIGRFYPDHFDVDVNSGRFAASCGDFTYIGQDFTYETMPSLTITAKNSIGAGGTTVNYTATNFMKLVVGDITRVFPLSDTTQTGVLGNLMEVERTLSGGETLVADGAGVMTYSFDTTDLYRYTKNENAEIGPFDSSLSIVVNNFDDDDNAANGTSIADVTPLAPTGSTDNSNLYGRFVMQNTYGPETDDLAMEAYTEFLDADLSASGQYVLNSGDNCTNLLSTITLDPEGSGTEDHDAITVGGGTSDFSYNPLLIGGEAGFLFTAPGAGNDGEIDVSIELLTFPWLQYDWDGDGTLQNPPDTTASFGQYRGHDRIIYWREIQ